MRMNKSIYLEKELSGVSKKLNRLVNTVSNLFGVLNKTTNKKISKVPSKLLKPKTKLMFKRNRIRKKVKQSKRCHQLECVPSLNYFHKEKRFPTKKMKMWTIKFE